jgi:hypothetical protein
MTDFTLDAFRNYLQAIQTSFCNILRMDEFFLMESKPETVCLLRHDVDRRAKNALRMAEIEAAFNVRATYYFRSKPHVFRPEIIRSISDLGHEIGYHYECLSDRRGNLNEALEDFEKNLERFRSLVPIQTIAMHGRPFSKYDNRNLWADGRYRLLREKYGLLGEVYLGIDYSEMLYVSDTGRNWSVDKSNIRDKVRGIHADFKDGTELLHYLENDPCKRLVFQTHPERWADNLISHFLYFSFDKMTNVGKSIIRNLGSPRSVQDIG